MSKRITFRINMEKLIERKSIPGYVFNQKAFADAVGVSEPTISRLRNGPVSSIHAYVLKPIADYWGVRPADILEIIEVDDEASPEVVAGV